MTSQRNLDEMGRRTLKAFVPLLALLLLSALPSAGEDGLSAGGSDVGMRPRTFSGGEPLSPNLHLFVQVMDNCTGTMLSPVWVLTSAYCLFEGEQPVTSVKVGRNCNPSSGFCAEWRYEADGGILRVLVHPEFNVSAPIRDNSITWTRANLALIQLGSPFTGPGANRWARLPTLAHRDSVERGQDVVWASYGDSGEGARSSALNGRRATIYGTDYACDDDMPSQVLCTRYSGNTNDRGSSLVSLLDGEVRILGVWTLHSSRYAWFVSVAHQRDWIQSRMLEYRADDAGP